MRIVGSVAFFFVLLCFSTPAQEKEQWQRVATFEDTTVDVDTTTVVFGSQFTGRVRLRFRSSKVQPVPGNTEAKSRVVIESVEFQCVERRYRVFSVEWLDDKGNKVDASEPRPDGEWKPVKAGSVMSKLMAPSCELISERRRNP
jgi:hypothetical protein